MEANDDNLLQICYLNSCLEIKKIEFFFFLKKDTGQSCDPGLNGLQHPTLKCDVLFGSHGDAGGRSTISSRNREVRLPLWSQVTALLQFQLMS